MHVTLPLATDLKFQESVGDAVYYAVSGPKLDPIWSLQDVTRTISRSVSSFRAAKRQSQCHKESARELW